MGSLRTMADRESALASRYTYLAEYLRTPILPTWRVIYFTMLLNEDRWESATKSDTGLGASIFSCKP